MLTQIAKFNILFIEIIKINIPYFGATKGSIYD